MRIFSHQVDSSRAGDHYAVVLSKGRISSVSSLKTRTRSPANTSFCGWLVGVLDVVSGLLLVAYLPVLRLPFCGQEESHLITFLLLVIFRFVSTYNYWIWED